MDVHGSQARLGEGNKTDAICSLLSEAKYAEAIKILSAELVSLAAALKECLRLGFLLAGSSLSLAPSDSAAAAARMAALAAAAAASSRCLCCLRIFLPARRVLSRSISTPFSLV